MNTSNQIDIHGDYASIFERAAAIDRWPEILPHYRWVRILERRPDGAVVAEMAARHRGLPLWWRTIQTPLPDKRRILYKHIGGITTGMEVQWVFEPRGPRAWQVSIHHEFSPRWPWVGGWIAQHIVGDLFVEQVAAKTLARMKTAEET